MSDRLFETGIDNLDYLLHGGVRWVGNRPPSILIHGPAGAGKSVLCGSLAAHTLRAKQSVAYFSLEQRAADIEDLSRCFHWWNDSFAPYIQIEETESDSKLPDNGKPVFGIFQYTSVLYAAQEENPSKPGAALLSYIRKHLDVLTPHNLGLIVIDSLPDAVREQSTAAGWLLTFDQRRSLFLSLCELGEGGKEKKYQVPVVIALETTHEAEWREYVADAVIQLGIDYRPETTSSRFLRIRKARNQQIVTGSHPMRILTEKGLTIHPNFSEVLFRLRSHAQPPSGALTFSDIKGMDGFMGQSVDAGASVLKGSATLLYGHDQTRKNGVAVSFLLKELESTSHACIYLAAGQSEAVTKAMVETYFRRFGIADPSRFADRMKFVRVDQYGASLSGMLDELRTMICGAAVGSEVGRVVVNDLAAIKNVDLILMLKELFLAKGITSLFVHSVFDDKDSPHRELFDNVIRTKRVLAPDRLSTRITYRLNKIQGASIQPTLWELAVERGTQKLVIQDTLRNYQEDRAGVLHSPPLELVLWCPFADVKADCKTIFKVIFGAGEVDDGDRDVDAPTLTLFYRFEAELIFESVRSMPSNQLLPKTRVLCFDDPWAQELLRDEKLEALDDQKEFRDVLATLHPRAKEGCYSKINPGQLLALPHHIDFGFYLLHKDVLKHLPREIQEDAFARPITWNELQPALEKAKGDSARHLVEVSSNGMDESFICFVLEVLKPFLELHKEDLGFGEAKAIAALKKLHAVLGACLQEESPMQNVNRSKADYSREDGPPASQKTALLQRHWYVSYRRLIREWSEIADQYVLIRPPALVVEDYGSQPAQTLRGDWFLGVIKGSPTPARGTWAMRVLTGTTANAYLHSHGLGLPIRKPFLPDSLGSSKLEELYDESWSRREIPQYRVVRGLLLNCFTEIFGKKDPSIDLALDELCDRLKEASGKTLIEPQDQS